MNSYPNQPNPEYQGGYQQQPPQQPYYPPQQAGYPYQQPVPPQYQPYPQQMMYPQQQINVNVGYQRPQQISMLVRFIYFCFVGWWIGMLWLGIALGFCCSIIGLPIGLMMLNRLGAVMTLSRR
ncbi:MAG TPA: YccF domain-containing protein [Ktedonobacteraceae bacterium]|nr:YccF domain-containing protein [Ktedonobacteraceae bacterium]